jgi:hypothetical protein
MFSHIVQWEMQDLLWFQRLLHMHYVLGRGNFLLLVKNANYVSFSHYHKTLSLEGVEVMFWEWVQEQYNNHKPPTNDKWRIRSLKLKWEL